MKCTVVRDGKESELEARDLVPGDIIILEEGSTIPADAKVSHHRRQEAVSERYLDSR
jgi:magnesium-transporting ATPase (P-type)